MKPVLRPNEQIHFVDDYQLNLFIEVNSEMDYSEVNKYKMRVGIVSGDDYPKFWNKSAVENPTTEAEQWIYDFFEAHPWMNRIAIVFTD